MDIYGLSAQRSIYPFDQEHLRRAVVVEMIRLETYDFCNAENIEGFAEFTKQNEI